MDGQEREGGRFSLDSQINIYLCNRCLSPLLLKVMFLAHRELWWIQHYSQKDRRYSPDTRASPTNKIDRLNITLNIVEVENGIKHLLLFYPNPSAEDN